MSDELYEKAVELARSSSKPTIEKLREHLGVGFSRATRLMDALEFHGVVSKVLGSYYTVTEEQA